MFHSHQLSFNNILNYEGVILKKHYFNLDSRLLALANCSNPRLRTLSDLKCNKINQISSNCKSEDIHKRYLYGSLHWGQVVRAGFAEQCSQTLWPFRHWKILLLIVSRQTGHSKIEMISSCLQSSPASLDSRLLPGSFSCSVREAPDWLR